MDKAEFFDLIRKEADKLNITIDSSQSDRFYEYTELLLQWNSVMNLTAITDVSDIIVKHYIDSLTLLRFVDTHNIESIIDVGSGAGFPGIPVKIMRPDIRVCLADSLGKRVNFLNAVIDKLELKDITAVHSRAETLGRTQGYRESFDCSVARAVAATNILLEYCVPFVKLNGCFVAMKSLAEEAPYKSAMFLLGCEALAKESYTIGENLSRKIIPFKRVKPLSSLYPRKEGIPQKKPL